MKNSLISVSKFGASFIMFAMLCFQNANAQFNILGQSSQSGSAVISFGNYPPQFLNEDALHCQTLSMCQYEISIQNTTILDTLFIVYNSYSQQDTIINSTSNPNYMLSTFPINPSSQSISSLQTIGTTFNGFISNYYHNLNKIICNGDTLDITYFTAMNPYNSSCTYSTVSGNVYIDNDGDCLFTNGIDAGIQGVNIQSESFYSIGNRTDNYFTNSIGQFSENYFKSNDGFTSANFYLPSIYNFAYSLPTCASPIETITSLPSTALNFPRLCAADVDVAVYGQGPWIRPLIPFNYYPSVRNIGCMPISGVLKLVLDPNLTYNATNSTNPADYIIGDTLFWNYTNLTNIDNGSGYWNSMNGGVELTPNSNVNIGDVIALTLITDIPSNDAFPSNNVETYYLPVVNSYDPNIKEVSPKGVGSEGYIPSNTEKLTYTIHFQNTGNAEAINIVILDTLEAHVIHNTLKIINASHLMNPNWLSNDVVQFNFPNINLADSNTNEPASHGFVTFEIELEQNLVPATEITNTAYIYFDANPAIVTNTAKNTIELTSSASIHSLSNPLGIIVSPNPMKESTTFTLSNGNLTNLEVHIIDLTGKPIISKTVANANSITVNKDHLSPGVYLYQLTDLITNKSAIGRIVIE